MCVCVFRTWTLTGFARTWTLLTRATGPVEVNMDTQKLSANLDNPNTENLDTENLDTENLDTENLDTENLDTENLDTDNRLFQNPDKKKHFASDDVASEIAMV